MRKVKGRMSKIASFGLWLLQLLKIKVPGGIQMESKMIVSLHAIKN